MRAILVTVVVGVALAAFTLVTSPRADETKPADETFKGKILGISISCPGEGGAIQNPRLAEFGGRKFLVGESVDILEEGLPPETFWFALDQVQMIREWKTIEDARKAYGDSGEGEDEVGHQQSRLVRSGQ